MPPNAKPRDAQAGWQIYRESGYAASLEEINGELTVRGFGPIAQRSYAHYQKLHRYGYQRYVPINVVDVETHRTPPWGGPLRSRYRPRPRNVDLQLIIATSTQTTAVDAQTVEVSNAEITVRVQTEALEGLSALGLSSLEHLHVLVVFAGPSGEDARSAEIELVFPEPGESYSVLTLAFLTPILTYEIPGQELMPRGTVTVTLDIVDHSSPDVLVRTMTALFEAFDASRALSDEILGRLDPSGLLALPAIEVTQLTMSSPLVVVLAGPAAVLAFVRWQVRGLLKLRQQWYQGSIAGAEAEATSASANVQNARAEFLREQTRTLRIRNDMADQARQVDPTGAVAALVRVMEGAVPQLSGTSLSPQDSDHISELFRNEVLPSLEKLLADTLKSIDIKPDQELEERLQGILPDEQEGDDGSASPMAR